MRDLYDILGVDRNASEGELKQAYRSLAMNYHPDRNPDNKEAAEKFKEINQAYDILRDPEKRSAYDNFGHAAFDGTSGSAHGGFSGAGGFTDIFEDLFGEFMGGSSQGRRKTQIKGADLKYDMKINLTEAYQGTEKTIKLTTSVSCETCSGSGAAAGSTPVVCSMCKGAGKIRATQGFFTVERTCGECRGEGKKIKEYCKKCSGRGSVQREKSLSVHVPKGVDDGTRIRLSGEGEAGSRGGPAGDLYIFVGIQGHPIFQRDGADLLVLAPIPMVAAAIGDEVEVPTPDGGMVRVAIPAGTQPGRRFRLRGKGMPVLQGRGNGDLYVEALIEVPTDLSSSQKKRLLNFAEHVKLSNYPNTSKFIKNINKNKQ